MALSEAPAADGPQEAAVVARVDAPGGPLELLAPAGREPVRCAGCATDLAKDVRCFTLKRLGGTGVPFAVCTACEPLPAGARIASEHPLRRECAHPGCRHPRLVSRIRLVAAGSDRRSAELRWEHEAPASDWGPRGAVHRAEPGPAVE